VFLSFEAFTISDHTLFIIVFQYSGIKINFLVIRRNRKNFGKVKKIFVALIFFRKIINMTFNRAASVSILIKSFPKKESL